MIKQHRTILIIDASSDQDLYRAALLTDANISHTILHESSVERGLAVYRANLPDGIILSVDLPDQDSLTFLTALKTETGIRPPVVVVAHGNERLAVQAMKGGAADYLSKLHLTPDQLRTALHNAIEAATDQSQRPNDSEAIYRAIVEDQTDLICRFLPDGTLTFVNPACCRYFGLSSAELVGHSFFYLFAIDPTCVHQRIQELSSLTPKHSVIHHEYDLCTPDGHQTWQHWVNRGIFDDSGQLVELQAVGRDITDRKRLEVELQQSQELLALAVAAVDCLIYDWDFQTKTVERSRGLTSLLGYAPQEAGTSLEWWGKQIHPEDWILLQDEFTINLATADRYSYEYRVRHKDGHYLWVQDQGILVRDTTGQLVRIVGSTTNIDDRKRAEAAFRESEERFRKLFYDAPIGMALVDIDYRIVDINDAFCTMLGYSRAELTQMTFVDITHPDDVDLDLGFAERAIRGEIAHYRLEKRYVKKNREVVWVSITSTAIRDCSGKVRYGLGMIEDISERKRSEAERKQVEASLLQNEALFRGVFESNLMGILFWHLDGQITDVNDAFVRMLGYSREELISGQVAWTEITPPEYREYDTQKFELMKATGAFPPFEKEYICKDGSRIPILLGCAFLPGSSDRGIAFVLDIRNQKQLKREREMLLMREQTAREAAEIANRTKDEFLAIVSHELRSPLNAILGWSKLLRTRQLDPATINRALETIERNTQTQVQLIEDLLDISRMLQGQLRLTLAPVNLNNIIETMVNSVRLTAEAKQVRLVFTANLTHGRVLGDLNRLQQVISNLLSNAIKFTPPNGQVNITLQQFGDQAQIRVVDTGKGISADFLPYVFERFRRVDSSTTRSKDGLGLGLAIVRHLVELHHGTVTADSLGEGFGSTFTVNLPLLQVETAVVATDPPQVSASRPPLKELRILVVDDEQDTREYLTFALEAAGATVHSADSTQAALDILQQFQPDILLTDIGMPEEDGYMLLQRVRRIEHLNHIPAIALTAYAKQQDRDRALQAGFQAHLTKPIEPIDLIKEIVSLVKTD